MKSVNWLTLSLIALVVLGAGTVAMKKAPRGIRNNNPFNIKDSNIEWRGETGRDDDKTFEEFKNPVDGIRAGVKILLNYQKLHGLKTVRGLINRFAPPKNRRGEFENDTNSYVSAVSRAIKVDPDETINVEQHLLGLSRAIIKHENGFNPYTDRLIRLGIQAAYA